MKLINDSRGMGLSLLLGPGKFIILYSLLVLSPLILARLIDIEPKSSLHDLAIGCGMLSLMILLTSFFFSGRFKRLNGERGMDLMLRFHRRIVMIALLLIIGHVVLIIPNAMPSEIWPVAIAFFLLILTIIISKSRLKKKMSYEAWRGLHGLIAVLIVCFACYHAISEGYYSAHPLIAFLFISLTVFSVFSLPFVHGYLMSKSRRAPYLVTELVKAGEQQWTITIKPVTTSPFTFHSGQFTFVEFVSKERKSVVHPFSMVSAPSVLPEVSFTIKEVGDFTKGVAQIEIGSEVYLHGAHGYLTRESYRGPKNKGAGIVLFAAGIGITPMISILREMKAEKSTTPVKLFYACRYEADILYKNELEDLVNELDFELQFLLSKPELDWQGECGRINANYIEEKVSFADFEKYIYFVCGTTSFVSDTVDNLDRLKSIPVFNIRYEDFSVYN